MNVMPTEHGLKIAATKTGCSPDEYRKHVESNEAWCSGHGTWHATTAFGPSVSRWNGLNARCRDARSEYHKATHVASGIRRTNLVQP